jgi:hypothetical protein
MGPKVHKLKGRRGPIEVTAEDLATSSYAGKM